MKITSIQFSDSDLERIENIRKHYALHSTSQVISFILNKENRSISKVVKK